MTLGWAANVGPKFPGPATSGAWTKAPFCSTPVGFFLSESRGLGKTDGSRPKFNHHTRLVHGWSTQAQELERAPGSPDCSREQSLTDSPNTGMDRMKYAFLLCLQSWAALNIVQKKRTNAGCSLSAFCLWVAARSRQLTPRALSDGLWT